MQPEILELLHCDPCAQITPPQLQIRVLLYCLLRLLLGDVQPPRDSKGLCICFPISNFDLAVRRVVATSFLNFRLPIAGGYSVNAQSTAANS